MAIGKASDFKIYEEEFYGGMAEALAQNSVAFNAASNGALRLVSQLLKGQYEKESFIKDISGMVSRRDTTSVASATDLAMTQDEFIGVKVNRKIGPIAQTLDAWRKIGKTQEEMSIQFGRMVGQRVLVDQVNSAIAAVEAAIQGQANLVHTISPAGVVTYSELVNGLAKFGDAAGRVVCWVMHSKPYFDLMKAAVTDKIFGVANVAIYQGTIATFGRPTIVIDAPSLVDAGSPNTYNVLGLVEGAVVVKESESREIVSQLVTGLENLVMRVQGEYAFNLSCKGFKWDIANGGANPADATIATATNWDKVATSDKDLAGVRIVAQ